MKAEAITHVRFSGAPPGGYLVCDEVRLTPRADAAAGDAAARTPRRMVANAPIAGATCCVGPDTTLLAR